MYYRDTYFFWRKNMSRAQHNNISWTRLSLMYEGQISSAQDNECVRTNYVVYKKIFSRVPDTLAHMQETWQIQRKGGKGETNVHCTFIAYIFVLICVWIHAYNVNKHFSKILTSIDFNPLSHHLLKNLWFRVSTSLLKMF